MDQTDLYIRMSLLVGERKYFKLPQRRKKYLIGRRQRGGKQWIDIPLSDRHVSRKHCEISWTKKSGWAIKDLNTTTGTTLNGKSLFSFSKLDSGDQVLIGTTLLYFSYEAEDGVEEYIDLDQLSQQNRDIDDAGGDEDETLIDEDETLIDEDVTLIDEDVTLLKDEIDSGDLRFKHPYEISEEDTIGANGADDDDDNATVLDGDVDNDATVLGGDDDEDVGTELLAKEFEPDAHTIAADQGGEGKAPDEPATVVGESSPQSSTVDTGMATVIDEDAEAQRASRALRSIKSGVPEPALPPLGVELVEHGLLPDVKAKEIAKKARETGMTFVAGLANDEEVKTFEEIYQFLSEREKIELVVSDKELDTQYFPVEWIGMISAEGRGLLPLEPRESGEFRFAVMDPFDLSIDDFIRRNTDLRIAKELMHPDAFKSVLNRLKSLETSNEDGEMGLAIDISIEQERQIRANISEANVPQIVNFFLHRGFNQGASDIHVEPTETALLVRNRVDGLLREDASLPGEMHAEVVSRIKIMSKMDVAEKRRPQDGRIGARIRGAPIDVRVSTYPTVYGEKIVMRLLDKNALRPSPEHLGLLARDLRVLKDNVNAPFGLIMISGPTGSGKTTTLYSCLGSIDKDAKNVLTVEDPVEYRLKGVHQMQVNEKIGLTFASGLRTILRQDPDVIMIGECRDQETAAMAIQASLTGHIVFSTIHTNDAVGVVTRMIDMKLDRFLVANALSLTIAQRLVRCVCKHCQTTKTGEKIIEEVEKDGISQDRLKELAIEIDRGMLYTAGAGCVHCNNTGYLGRRAVFEVFEMTSDARNIIMSDQFSSAALYKQAQKNGMITLIRHGLHLVDEGVTTHEEVLRVLGETQ